MCFAMPLRSAPSASDNSHLRCCAQPGRMLIQKFGENRKVLYRVLRGLRVGSNIDNVSRRMPGKISLKGGPAIGQDPLLVSKLRIVPPKT